MFEGFEDHFQPAIPTRPGARYAHVVVLRRTDSYAVFKTDGELNTARVARGVVDQAPITRLTIFKRKQSTPERLTGRELLRRYGVYDQIQQTLGRECKYNEDFCGVCPDCVMYGYAIGETGSEKSKVYVDTAYSLTSYDDSHETFTLNAPFEDGTMTKGGATTNRFSEQDHVKPGVSFPGIVTLRDPTPQGLAYLLNNLRRTRLYGAQTTRTGHVENVVAAIIFADGEIFSNLRLTQAVFDQVGQASGEQDLREAVVMAARELVRRDGVVYQMVEGEALETVMTDLDAIFTDAGRLRGFLQDFAGQTREYADLIGVTGSAKKKK